MSMRSFMLSMVLIMGIFGCESGDDFSPNNNTTSNDLTYNVFFCASIGVSSQSSQTYHSGIYGADLNALNSFKKIIDLDGTDNLIDTFTVDNDGNLYWGNCFKHAIYKANPDGSNPHQIISGLDIPFGLTIDQAHQRIYWADLRQSDTTQSGHISYANLDGSNPTLIIDTLHSGGHLLIDPTESKLYIADLFGGTIVQSDLDGNNLSTLIQANQPEQMALDATGSKLYWADIADDALYVVNLDGSAKQAVLTFVDDFANPIILALHENQLLFNGRETINGNSTEVLKSFDLQKTQQSTLNTSLPSGAKKIIIK